MPWERLVAGVMCLIALLAFLAMTVLIGTGHGYETHVIATVAIRATTTP